MDHTINYSDHECRQKLQELFDGRSVALPVDENHAKFMIIIATRYLEDRHQVTFDALKANYE
jgi:hypothetical protein